MIIHLSTLQIVFLWLYAILFSYALAYLATTHNDYPRKKTFVIFSYWMIFLVVEVVFTAGLYGAIFSAHAIQSTFVLVTLKWNEEKVQFGGENTELVDDDEATTIKWFFNNNTQTPRQYQYLLIDDKNNMQIFHSGTQHLLQHIKNIFNGNMPQASA